MNAITQYVMKHPPAGIAVGLICIAGFGAIGATSARSAARLPKAPAQIALGAVDPVADVEDGWMTGAWVRVVDGAWLCDRAVVDGDRTYVPIGETPRSLVLASVPSARPCSDWAAASPVPEGLLHRGRDRLRARLFADSLGAQRLILLTANEGAGAVIGLAALSAAMVAFGAWLAIWSWRRRVPAPA